MSQPPPPAHPALDRAAVACIAAGMVGTLLALPFAVPPAAHAGWSSVIAAALRLLVLVAVPLAQLAGGVLMMRGSVRAAAATLLVTTAGTVLVGALAGSAVLAALAGTGAVLVVLLVAALRRR
jgi:O-antigen/teichoic acid export membrane protein